MTICKNCDRKLLKYDEYFDTVKCSNCSFGRVFTSIGYDCGHCAYEHSNASELKSNPEGFLCKSCGETKNKDDLFKLKIDNNEKFTLDIDIDGCIETMPCNHAFGYKFEDGFEYWQTATPNEIYDVYQKHGQQFPDNFSCYPEDEGFSLFD